MHTVLSPRTVLASLFDNYLYRPTPEGLGTLAAELEQRIRFFELVHSLYTRLAFVIIGFYALRSVCACGIRSARRHGEA